MADLHPNGDDSSSKTRRRAVCLTDEGLTLLKQALLRCWERDRGSRRMTRKIRADMLGVSEPTGSKIMSGQGVDRSSLLIAFGNLGLEWSDDYCVHVRTNGAIDHSDCVESAPGESAAAAEAEFTSGSALSEVPSPPVRRKRWVWAVAAFAFVVALCQPISVALDAWGYGQKQQSVHQRLVAEYYAGIREYQIGNFRSAKEHCDRVLALSRESRSYYDLAMALRLAGEIAAAKGDLQRAKQHFLGAVSIRETVQDVSALPATYEVLGDLEIRLREFDSAERHLAQSLEGYRKARDKVGVAMALRNLGWLDFQRGDHAKATAYYDQALAEVHGDSDNVDLKSDIEARMALVLGEQGHHDAARAILNECLRHWRAKPHARWVGRTSFQIGTLERSAGRSDLARKWLEEARATFQSVGDVAGVEECENELRALDRNAGRPAPKALATWSTGR